MKASDLKIGDRFIYFNFIVEVISDIKEVLPGKVDVTATTLRCL